MRKIKGLSLVFILLPGIVHAQVKDSSTHRTRNIAFTTPVSKNTTINGLAIGLMAEPWGKAATLQVNGLNIELAPFSALLGFPYALFGTVVAPFQKDTTGPYIYDFVNKNIFTEEPTSFDTKIRGISISAGGLTRGASAHGLIINGLISWPEEVRGIEITGFMNMHYDFTGLMIAGVRNKTTTGKGVQIALFNTCKEGKVVQFGLINRIGKRITPVLNFSL